MSLMPNLNTRPSHIGAAPGARAVQITAAARGGGFAQVLGQAQLAADPLTAGPVRDPAEAPREAPEDDGRAQESATGATAPDAGAAATSASTRGPAPRAPAAAARATATDPLQPAAAPGADDLLAQTMAGRATTDAAEETPFVAAPHIATETMAMPAVSPLPPVAAGPEAAGAGLLTTAPASTSTSTSVPGAEATLAAQPGSSAFATELSAQLTTYVRQGVQHARLHLNPADLGPVDVRIQIDGDAARVVLMAEQAPTRQWLEQALPSLAGSLREAGLTLAGGGVFERSPGGGGNGGQQAPGGRGEDRLRDPESAASASLPPAGRRRGVIDLVA